MAKAASMILRGSMLRNVQMAVVVACSFYTLPILLHSLGDRWYGLWVIAGTFLGYYGLLDFGLTSATRRFLAMSLGRKDDADANVVLNTSLAIFSGLSLLSIVITGAVLAGMPLFVPDDEERYVLMLVFLILGLDMAQAFPMSVFEAVLFTKLRLDLMAKVNIVKVLLRTALVIYFLKAGHGILTLALLNAGFNFAARMVKIMLAARVYPELRLGRRFIDATRIRTFVNYSGVTFLAQLGDMIRFRVDNMVIAYFMGSAKVAHYNIATQIHNMSGEVVSNLMSGTPPILTGYYARKDMAGLREKFLLLTRCAIIIALCSSGAAIALAEPFIIFWVGPEYLTAFLPLLILRSISVFGIGQAASVQVMYAMAKHKFYAAMNIFEAVANLLLSLVLVQRFGLVGVAIGTAIPFVIAKVLVMPPYVCRLLEIPLARYYREMGALIIVVGASQLPLYFLIQSLEGSPFILLFGMACIYYAVYGLLAFNFILPRTDRAFLLSSFNLLRMIHVRRA